ncbi:nuclear receptor-binding factor 2-like isoform X1 [Homalodisca vitripennis]|uniref:nuclear receptor-binding factor 2-like isoform X1 n=2 Tax=Homalodisca vitripennis TaxID=197043 RepID=UPI001EE9AF52|nr:nuclear receptor-binding factor 2-like isoform X1 [Homalodisca vitripennis]
MENSPLLLAHQNDRKADNHIQYKRFDEALTCHKAAAELLLHAMQLTSVTKAVEALRLQYDYHKRQEDIVQVKKVQFEIKKKIMEYRNRRTMQKKTTQKEKKDKDLQWAIFKTMEEADSLLGLLLPKEAPEAEVATVPGFKRPKDEQTVIEELYTLNTQLRIFITQLLTKLETAERQLEVAKIRLEVYENAPPKIIDLPPLDMSVSESLEASKYEFPAPTSKEEEPNTGQGEN